ncbi:unnamed protein product [Ilex paraguariensis]|uniref:Uncharacterized protein n=1 Tax=Ilex paraguariensis TaxID=185542 RepID=A0ABC8RDU9_9AQUA
MNHTNLEFSPFHDTPHWNKTKQCKDENFAEEDLNQGHCYVANGSHVNMHGLSRRDRKPRGSYAKYLTKTRVDVRLQGLRVCSMIQCPPIHHLHSHLDGYIFSNPVFGYDEDVDLNSEFGDLKKNLTNNNVVFMAI